MQRLLRILYRVGGWLALLISVAGIYACTITLLALFGLLELDAPYSEVDWPKVPWRIRIPLWLALSPALTAVGLLAALPTVVPYFQGSWGKSAWPFIAVSGAIGAMAAVMIVAVPEYLVTAELFHVPKRASAVSGVEAYWSFSGAGTIEFSMAAIALAPFLAYVLLRTLLGLPEKSEAGSATSVQAA